VIFLKIGVLALQGDFREHICALNKIGVESTEVKTKADLDGIDGLIIPGGESTAIGKLLSKYSLDKAIIKKYKKGMAIYGTCAGAILLAKEIEDSTQPSLGLIDMAIARNAYGRQIDSFEADIHITGMKKPFNAIFIRAPIITKIRNGVKIIAKHKSQPVMLRKDKILISTFHPELTDDLRVHEYFLSIVKEN
jgi:5'-phosphate synthase pdxT subunit